MGVWLSKGFIPSSPCVDLQSGCRQHDIPIDYADANCPLMLQLCAALGACAMTTNFSTIKFVVSIFIAMAFPKKNSVFGRLSSLPPMPCPPPQKRKFHFYCRLAVSETPKNTSHSRTDTKLERLRYGEECASMSKKNINCHGPKRIPTNGIGKSS